VRNLLLAGTNNQNNNSNSSTSNNRVLPVRSSVKRTMSAHHTETRIAKLQAELNEATVKHSETVYWLQLELNTTRKAKEAVEDRMAELYRDMQELEKPKKPRPIQPDAAYVAQQQKQIDKYERMLKVLNNQIGLVRSSADSLVKNLKDEIADLMEDKVKNELQLMNKLSALDREKRDLEQQLAEERRKNNSNSDSRQQRQSLSETASTETPIPLKQPSVILEEEHSEHSESPTAPSSLPTRKTAPPRPPCRHKSIEYDDPTPLRTPRRQKSAQDDSEVILELLEDDLKRLRAENGDLKDKLQKQKMGETLPAETEKLSAKVEQYKTKTMSLDSKLTEARNKAHETLVKWTREKADLQEQINTLQKEKASNGGPATEDREIVLEALDRVALLWDRADQSIQAIESVMMEVRPNPSQDAERALSMLETASLVHGQIKVSLMLIELQFRNSLSCLEHDQSATRAFSANGSSKILADKVQSIQTEAVESISKIESLVDEQIKELRIKSEEESAAIREMHEGKAIDLRQLLDRQAELEKEIERLQSEKSADGRKLVPSAVEMLVSQKALETLQSEVLLIVERVKDKNEMIGRLNAEIEEHKVRERTLMEELKRHMKDQSDRQMAEQQRLMEQHAQYDSSEEEGSTAGSEYEEKTVEESVYDEITVNEDNFTVS